MKSICKTLVSLAVLCATAALSADVATIQPQAVHDRMVKQDPKLLVVDVRTTEEFAQGHVPGAINIPHDQVTLRIAELLSAKDKDIVLYCRSGRRSQTAAETLKAQGFTRLSQLEGNIQGWIDAKLPVAK